MDLSLFDPFILKHQLELNKEEWNEISEKYELSIDLVRVLQNKLNWERICKFQTSSISFIEEFINYQLRDYIPIICKYQVIIEEFVEKYKHLVNWDIILENQNFSVEFYLKHADDIKTFRKSEWNE